MFFEQLSEEEKVLIDYMRKWGAENDSSFGTHSFSDCDWFLRFWEYNKQRTMSKVFKDSLILKKKVNITMEDDELFDDMSMLVRSNDFEDMRESIYSMLRVNNDLQKTVGSIDPTSDFYYYTIHDVLYQYLFSNTNAIIENKYEGPSLELMLSNGSVFKLVHGCKVMKALNRLARAAGVSEAFEDIRIKQSQIMNEAKISANLCLSIHPLDYMTASYNNNGWHSCMNWEDGDYRRGVIEMMNSACVVVAYLESGHNYLRFWVDPDHPEVKWNSKKWREFMIVSDEGIFGIKGYPYWNHKLEDEALKWLKELFSEDDKQYSNKIIEWDVDKDGEVYDNTVNSSFKVHMDCGPAMYNDFYSGNTYHAILKSNFNPIRSIYINYSGESECVCCGEEGDFEESSMLSCEDCDDRHYCDCCGEEIETYEDLYEFDGHEFCYDCYNSQLPRCSCCDEIMPFDMYNNYAPTKGIQFHIGHKNSPYLFTTRLGVFPITYNVCEDCADEVFKKGREEINTTHECHRSWGNSCEIVLDENIKDFSKLDISDDDITHFLSGIEKAEEIA